MVSREKKPPSMRNCKRPRVNHERDFYQTPTDFSEEEIQRCCEFVKKLKKVDDDKRIFDQCVDAMKSYTSGSLTYVDLKQRVVSILSNRDGLLEELHQLLSGLASPPGRNSIKEKNRDKKSDVERTVEFLNKAEALGESVYKAFIGALWFPGDIEILVEQLDVIFCDHTSLKEEFETFLIDSRLLKPKRDLEAAARPITEGKQEISEECRKVTPSYSIRPEAELEGSCSSDEVLNGKYVSVGRYDPEKVKKKSQPRRDVRMNNLEDKCMEQDMILHSLASVIDYGKGGGLVNKELCHKPPVRFKYFLQWFYKEDRNVPEIFKTDPRRGVQDILPELQSMEKKMRETQESRNRSIYNRVNK